MRLTIMEQSLLEARQSAPNMLKKYIVPISSGFVILLIVIIAVVSSSGSDQPGTPAGTNDAGANNTNQIEIESRNNNNNQIEIETRCADGTGRNEAGVCEPYYYLVVGGYTGSFEQTAEILNVMDQKRCLVADYPIPIGGPTVFTYQNKPTLCGGMESHLSSFTRHCYTYEATLNTWSHASFQINDRSYGYAIEIGDEEYLILGGRAGSGFLRSTQIFRAGVLTDGPTLPQEDRYGIGTVKFNETHAFVGFSRAKDNYFLNLETMQWSKFADRNWIHGDYSNPAAGLYLNTTNNETEIIFIGSEHDMESYSLKTDTWTKHLKSMRAWGTYNIQVTSKYFLSFGGVDKNGLTSNVYRINERGMELVGERLLSKPRRSLVAIKINELPDICKLVL